MRSRGSASSMLRSSSKPSGSAPSRPRKRRGITDLEKTMKKGDIKARGSGVYIVRFARRGTVTGPKDAKGEKSSRRRSIDPSKAK